MYTRQCAVLCKRGHAGSGKTADGVVIIAGYDQYNTILLKPGEAETYYYGLEESADMFEAAGNQFVTYFDPLEE